MNIDFKTREYLENLGTIIKEDRIVCKSKDLNVVIPSAKYPLKNGEIKVFSEFNTVDITKDREIIEDIFNSVQQEYGRCYNNAEKLAEELTANKIDFKLYAGWLFVDRQLPIHHSFIVINTSSVIDLSVHNNHYKDLTYELLTKFKSKDEARPAYAAFIKDIAKNPNSETCTFGKVTKNTIYIATETLPSEARIILKDLMNKYPRHEAYLNLSGIGNASKLQQMLRTK